MRILVVNQYFHPDQSSTSQLLTELCEDLSAAHRVTVVCGRPSYSPTEEARTGGFVHRDRYGDITVLRTWSTSFSRHSVPGRVTNYGSYLASSLVGIMRAERPDVVLTMTDPPFVAAAAMFASRIRRVPFVYVNQDIFPEVAIALGALDDGKGAAALRRLNRSLRSAASAVVAIGRDMRERLVALGTPATRLHVIPNWADTDAIRPLDGPSPLRSAQGWDERFVVMHSGNVGLSQGLDTFVGAAQLLSDEPDIVFAIVGEGGSKTSLEERVSRAALKNVVFLPYQPKTELSESLGAADLHFIGLRRGLEGLIVPSKVYGIMAAGRPSIAAVERGSEIDLIQQEFGCGSRVEPDDPRSLADGILAARGGALEEQGAAARAAAVAHFDRHIATGAHRELLEHVAARHRT